MRYAHEQKQDSSTGEWRTPHGERRTYLAGCRCGDCSRAHTRYCKAGNLRRLQGQSVHVPYETFLRALDEMTAQGWSDTAMAEAAGLSGDTLRRARARGRPVRAGTYRALVAAGEPRRGLVPADLTRRRLRSLSRAGWDMGTVEREAGIRSLDGGKWRTEEKVSVTFAGKVRAAYDQLAHQPGPSLVAAGRGRAAGWPHPDEWDDPGTLAWPPGHTDEPDDGPDVDPVAVDRFLAGDDTITLTDDEKTEAIHLAHGRGVSHNQLMRRWKVSGTTFVGIRARHSKTPAAREGDGGPWGRPSLEPG